MNAVIGIYESNEKAVAALSELQKSGYPTAQLSIIAKASLVDNHIHIKTNDSIEKAEVSVGVVSGTILGILLGVGIFAIPGLGFLFGAGAVVGAFAGLDIGLIAGGLTAIFTSMGIDAINAAKYDKYLNDGKFIIFAQGDEKQVEQAQKVLHTQGLSFELGVS